MQKSLIFAIFSFSFLVALASAAPQYAQESSYFNVQNANVVLTSWTSDVDEIVRGGTISFSATVQNSGGAASNVTPHVFIYTSGGTLVANYDFTTATVEASQIAVFSLGVVVDLDPGSYYATGNASYTNGAVNSTASANRSFSITAASRAAGGGGGGGGGGPVALPPAINPRRGGVVFIQKSILLETLPTLPDVETMFLKNYQAQQEVVLSLEGVPSGWITLEPQRAVLFQGQKQPVQVATRVPSNATPGTYLVTLSVNSTDNRVISRDFLILRVKPLPAAGRLHTVKRITIDQESNTTTVSFNVRNPTPNKITGLFLQDRIAPSSRINRDSIVFENRQGKIEEKAGTVRVGWEFGELQPGESTSASYKIKLLLQDYVPYSEFTTAEAFFPRGASLEDVLRVVDFQVPALYPEISENVIIHTFYGGSRSISAITSLVVPPGFSVEPRDYHLTLIPGKSDEFKFKVTPPDSSEGSHSIEFLVDNELGLMRRPMQVTVLKSDSFKGLSVGLPRLLPNDLLSTVTFIFGIIILISLIVKFYRVRKFEKGKSDFIHKLRQEI